MVRLLPLTQGYFAIIDEEDYPLVASLNWYAGIRRNPDGSVKTVCAQAISKTRDGKWGTFYLHRIIMGVSDPLVQVDHRDRDQLNNRRSNLRVCSNQQNSCNRGLRRDNHAGIKGVTFHHGKWQARIRVNGKLTSLGHFDSPELAALAYEKAASDKFGEFASPLRETA